MYRCVIRGTDEQWSKNEAQIRKPADGPKSDRRKLAASFFSFSSDGLNYITIWWIYSRPWAQKIKTKDAETNKFSIWQEFFERKQESLPYSLFGSCFFNHRDTPHQQRHEVSILVLITPVVNNCFLFWLFLSYYYDTFVCFVVSLFVVIPMLSERGRQLSFVVLGSAFWRRSFLSLIPLSYSSSVMTGDLAAI